MKHSEQFQFIGHISPQVVLAGAQASVSEVIDTAGFAGGRLIITVMQGTMADSVGKCTLFEGDSSSNQTQTVARIEGTDADGVDRDFPDATSDNLDIVFDVPLNPERKRYFRVDWRAASTGGRFGNYVAVSAILLGRQLGSEVTTAKATKRNNSRLYRK
tara:strand:- start:179 stop:655 length:477 start_codon:yes stop_codon:yes gene_type:complete